MSKRLAIENIYPLAPLQEGMLFHALYAPESGVYVGQFGFVLEGPLDAEALERAWQGVVARHEALRAAFAWEGVPQPIQVIRREVKVPFRAEDWRELDEAGRRVRMEAYLETDRAQGFDLKRPPLMRLALFRVGEAEHRLVWTHHHLILDGWSLSLLFRDVLALYEAHARGETPRARTKTHPYREYVEWLGRQDRARAERFWREALAGFDTATPLPGVLARAGEARGQGAARRVLSPERTQALREQARRWGVTLSTVVQGAWGLLLSRWSGEEDVVFGGTVSGRPPELPGAEETVGLFINTLPVRVRLEPEAQLGEWLGRLQREQVEAREYEYAPLADVQRWSGVQAGEGLFDSLVAFENYPIDLAVREHGSRPGELRVRATGAIEQANYPLVVSAWSAEQLEAEIRYDRGRVDDEVAERMASHLEVLLESIADDPDQRLSGLSLLRAGERAELLAASRAVAVEHGHACVHELFARQAERTPDAAALAFEGETLTYAELERRANRLAHALRRRGVGPEVRVAVCAERSAELVVALLAVLKAGGAYVPIDPAYPAERIAYLLEDSGCAAVLVQDSLRALLGETPMEVIALEEALAESDGGDVRAAGRGGPGQRRVRDLHLGLHGAAQGRRRHPRQRVAPVRRHAAVVQLRGGGRVDTVPLVRVRLLGLGDLGRAAARRAPGGGAVADKPRPRSVLRPAGTGARDGAEPDAFGFPAARRRRRGTERTGGPGAAGGGVRRRGAGAGEPARVDGAARGGGAAAGEHVRDHRDYGPRDVPADPLGGRGGGGAEPGGPGDPGPGRARAGRVGEPGAGGRAGGAVRGRRGCVARLPGASRS